MQRIIKHAQETVWSLKYIATAPAFLHSLTIFLFTIFVEILLVLG